MYDTGEELTQLYHHLLEHDKAHLEGMAIDAERAGKGIKTGITLHNKLPDGKFKAFDLWIPKYAISLICARTGGGKSTWMINLANRMAMNGATGMYVTLEEPGFAIRGKMMASYSRMVNKNYSMESITSWDAIKMIRDRKTKDTPVTAKFDKEIMRRVRIVDANKTVDSSKYIAPTILYDPQFIGDLINHRNSIAESPLDFVIIDFGQLMESQDSVSNNSAQRIRGVMQACKNISGQLGNAVIIGAQLRREVSLQTIWDWEPEQIRDGSDMEQAATLILAAGDDKTYPDQSCQNVLRILKNRNGPKRVSGMFPIEFEKCYITRQGREPVDDA